MKFLIMSSVHAQVFSRFQSISAYQIHTTCLSLWLFCVSM